MRIPTFLPAAAALITFVFVAGAPALAQSSRADIETIVKNYLAEHPEEVQHIIKDYLVNNPEVLREALTEMIKNRRSATASADKIAAIKSNATLLFGSPHQVTLGNPHGDVTLVEFFDYNCGFCKRALADTTALLKDDPKLRIVLKELPVLGPGSTEAARVAVAVRMQDESSERYLAFHQKLLGGRGPVNKEAALAAAQEAGLDMTRLQTDLSSDEVDETLKESVRLAQALGITGTPGYVIGENIVPGAVGLVALKQRIQLARQLPN